MNILKILEADISKKKKDNSGIRSVIKSTKAAVVGIMNRFSSNGGSDPGSRNYDLAKIKNAIVTDSYLAVSIRKFSQLIAKGGYQLKSYYRVSFSHSIRHSDNFYSERLVFFLEFVYN